MVTVHSSVLRLFDIFSLQMSPNIYDKTDFVFDLLEWVKGVTFVVHVTTSKTRTKNLWIKWNMCVVYTFHCYCSRSYRTNLWFVLMLFLKKVTFHTKHTRIRYVDTNRWQKATELKSNKNKYKNQTHWVESVRKSIFLQCREVSFDIITSTWIILE